MIKKTKFKRILLRLLHKVAKYTKEQKIFVLFLFALAFSLTFFPLIKIIPVESTETNYIFLISGTYFKTMVLTYISLFVLLARNMSFRFKNFIINTFWFRESDTLLNFILLRIITTAFLSIWDTIKISQSVTSTINLTIPYYIIQLLLLAWLIITLISLIKKVKNSTGTKIINIVNEDAIKEWKRKKNIKWLFDKSEQ